MQELLIALVAALQALLALQTIESEPLSDTSDQVQSEAAQVEVLSTAPTLIYKTEEYEFRFPSGEVAGVREVSVPYLQYSDLEVQIFDEIAGLRIDHESWSPSEQYIYFSKGNGKDAAVTPFVFDVQNRMLHYVCTEKDVDCRDGYRGFAGQHFLQISWEGDLLRLEYDNPGLAPGASESGPAVGMQVYQSVSAGTPWIIKQTN